MGITVLLAAIGACDAGLPVHFWEQLDLEERARVARFRRASDRVQFAAARGLLRTALGRFGIVGARLVASDSGAKPHVVGDGVPAGLDCNISHADGLAACAVSWAGPVGIDVESRDRVIDGRAIAASRFAPAEQGLVHDTASFLTLWTLKEAVMKAAGLGLALPLRDFACGTKPPCLLASCEALGPMQEWHLYSWMEASHVVAVANRSATRQVIEVSAFDFTNAVSPAEETSRRYL